jgi:hypothetical protein
MAAKKPCTWCGTLASHSTDAQCLQQRKNVKRGAFYEREERMDQSMAPCNRRHQHASAHPAPYNSTLSWATSAHLPSTRRCGALVPAVERAAAATQTRCLLGSAPSLQPGATKPDKISCCRSSRCFHMLSFEALATGCANSQTMMEKTFSCVLQQEAPHALSLPPMLAPPYCQAMRRTS